MKQLILVLLILLIFTPKITAASNVEQMVNDIEPQVIKWRHHLHQNPELSNREFETAKYIILDKGGGKGKIEKLFLTQQ